LIVVRTVKPPFRRVIQHILVYDAALGIRARGKSLFRYDQIGLTHVTHFAIACLVVDAFHVGGTMTLQGVVLHHERLQFRPQFGFIQALPTSNSLVFVGLY
jgi:hypothetical protein